MNIANKIGKGAYYYKRDDPAWPWGYYRPHSSPYQKNGGHFVTTTEAEAKRLADQKK